MGWWVGLGSVGPKGAGWVPAGSLLTSLLAGFLLAGWLAGLIHFATDLLLPWFKGLGTKRPVPVEVPLSPVLGNTLQTTYLRH